MPELIKLYEDHADQRDRFEILAFHDPSAKTIEEIDQKLEEGGVIKDVWGGKNLPFPVLLDDSRTTLEAWGIRAFPTLVLIDPDGKLVASGREVKEMLKEKLTETTTAKTP